MKKLIPTAAALIVLGALAAYVGVYETGPKEDDPRELIYDRDHSEAVKFALEDLEKGLSLTCEKEDGVWWITGPRRLEAQFETADLAARHLSRPGVERRLGAQADLTPFKLDEPPYRASVTFRDGTVRTVLVGARNPGDSAYFMREKDSSTVYTVAVHSVDNFRKTVSELRNKVMMAVEPADVERLVVRRKKGGIVEFTRDGEDWRMVQPVKAKADRYAVDSLLNDIKNLKAAEIIEEQYAYSRHKLDQAGAEIVVYTRTGSPQKLTLSRPDPAKKDDVFASSTRVPQVARLSSGMILDASVKEAEEFRERLLFSVGRDDAAEVRIGCGGLEIVCVKGPRDRWAVKSPAGVKVEEELNDMLFEIVYARAEKFVSDAAGDPAKFGLARPRATVSFTGAKDGNPFAIGYRLGNRVAENVYMKMDDAPGVYEVRKELLEKVERFADKVKAEAPKK